MAEEYARLDDMKAGADKTKLQLEILNRWMAEHDENQIDQERLEHSRCEWCTTIVGPRRKEPRRRVLHTVSRPPGPAFLEPVSRPPGLAFLEPASQLTGIAFWEGITAARHHFFGGSPDCPAGWPGSPQKSEAGWPGDGLQKGEAGWPRNGLQKRRAGRPGNRVKNSPPGLISAGTGTPSAPRCRVSSSTKKNDTHELQFAEACRLVGMDPLADEFDDLWALEGAKRPVVYIPEAGAASPAPRPG